MISLKDAFAPNLKDGVWRGKKNPGFSPDVIITVNRRVIAAQP
jgi:hypothetical protein